MGEATGITKYDDAVTFMSNVNISALTGFNSYWDLTCDYPVFKSGLEYESGNMYEGTHVYNISATEDMIVENGATEYQIVQPNNPTTYELKAVDELRFFSQEQRI